MASSSALQLPLHQIESQQQAKGREVQRLLLQTQLQHRGNGDVGSALQLHQPDGELLYSHRRLGARSLTTVFGTVELVRMGYSRSGAPSIFPPDKALALPARSFSYELQRRLVKAAVQKPFWNRFKPLPLERGSRSGRIFWNWAGDATKYIDDK